MEQIRGVERQIGTGAPFAVVVEVVLIQEQLLHSDGRSHMKRPVWYGYFFAGGASIVFWEALAMLWPMLHNMKEFVHMFKTLRSRQMSTSLTGVEVSPSIILKQGLALQHSMLTTPWSVQWPGPKFYMAGPCRYHIACLKYRPTPNPSTYSGGI